MLVLMKKQQIRAEIVGEAVRVAVPGLYLACLPNWGPYYRASQDFIPHNCAPLSAPATQLWGVHEHVSSCGSKKSTGISPLHTSSCSCGFASLSSFLFPSSLGIDSDVECLGTSTRIYCLHCFLCMTLYAVSMLKKKKKRKEEKTLSKTNLHVLEKKKKKNRGCILSVRLGIMLLPLCAFGLCVAVFCQDEILSPLEDFRGGRATSPKIWRSL